MKLIISLQIGMRKIGNMYVGLTHAGHSAFAFQMLSHLIHIQPYEIALLLSSL